MLPAFRSQGEGLVINIGSILGRVTFSFSRRVEVFVPSLPLGHKAAVGVGLHGEIELIKPQGQELLSR